MRADFVGVSRDAVALAGGQMDISLENSGVAMKYPG
jgi:hypothetical protein